MPDAQAALLDDHDGAGLERRRGLGEADGKPLLNSLRASVLQPEKNNPGRRPATEGHDLAEIEIERQENATFSYGKREDILVSQLLQAAIEKMNGVMTARAQPRNDTS
jgi:hypothetical protein